MPVRWNREMRAGLRRLWFNLSYFRQPPWDTRVSPPELFQFIAAHPAGRALDLGCGTGTNLLTLAAHGWQVWGVEYAWRAASIARKRMRAAGVDGTVWTGDVTRMNRVDRQFDLVLDMGCYHGIPVQRRGAYQANLLRWLAPGGTYLLYAHWLAAEGDVGIREEEIEQFGAALNLRERQDGFDKPGRAAVWLRFER